MRLDMSMPRIVAWLCVLCTVVLMGACGGGGTPTASGRSTGASTGDAGVGGSAGPAAPAAESDAPAALHLRPNPRRRDGILPVPPVIVPTPPPISQPVAPPATPPVARPALPITSPPVAAPTVPPTSPPPAVVPVTPPVTPPAAPPPTISPAPQLPVPSEALRVADFILSLQDINGALRDAPGSGRVNEDSNMEYALMGVAAAYGATRDGRYLTGLERGIEWLAARAEMTDPRWRGSWFYAYSATPPYDPIPTSPGGGVQDVRGVDATSALFVYLLYLHRQVTQTDVLVQRYAAHARAALDFILTYNRSPDGFFYSSWQLRSGVWSLWRFQYAADQGDVYLGLRAGSLLYDGTDRRYGLAADLLLQNVGRVFFDTTPGRYAVGRETNGVLTPGSGFDVLFPQGYVPWAFAGGGQNLAAHHWLNAIVQPDGSVRQIASDPAYAISAAILAMSSASLSQAKPQSSLDWLVSRTLERDGGVRDSASAGTPKYSNVAGFAVLGLLGQRAW